MLSGLKFIPRDEVEQVTSYFLLLIFNDFALIFVFWTVCCN